MKDEKNIEIDANNVNGNQSQPKKYKEPHEYPKPDHSTLRKKKYGETVINKATFLKLVADDSGFTLTDTREFWNSVERVFARVIISGMTLSIGGFLNTMVCVVPPKMAFHINHMKVTKVPAFVRIHFKVSNVFKSLINQYKEEYFENVGFDEAEWDDKLNAENSIEEDV